MTFTGKLLNRGSVRSLTTANTNQNAILEPLIERGIIRVKGDEIVPFLQGLITNDIKHLHPSSNKAIYAMFLNKAGRVMYDVILYSTSDPTKILIECDKNITNDLQRHLKLFRVRRKIDVDSLHDDLNVWQAFIPNNKQPRNLTSAIIKEEVSNITISIDPRLKHLGTRILARSDKKFEDISKAFEQQTFSESSDERSYRLHRYSLGVAEGVTEMPPGKCFPLEANCDILNGVSFHKGCYIGQELTARVHHTGMIRKRHMPVKLSAPLAENNSCVIQNETGANCGIIYGSLANYALGLLRVENVLKAKQLMVNGHSCFTERPQWWPSELYSNTLKQVQKEI